MDYVKLGRELVTGAARNEMASATLRALATRATNLGARVVDVGVEDDAAMALLQSAGMYMTQGYEISPPLGVHQLAAWATDRGTPM